MLSRRQVLKTLGATAAMSGLPGIALAKADTDARFVLVVLRGAVDGLAFAPPYGDGNYKSLRGELAIGRPGASDGLLDLDGFFGLHPSLTGIHKHFARGQATVVHAVASPYRERSHFDGQDVLENGAAAVGLQRDGWAVQVELVGRLRGEEVGVVAERRQGVPDRVQGRRVADQVVDDVGVVARAREEFERNGEIIILCSGRRSMFSLEDAYVAGRLAGELLPGRTRNRAEVNDAAIAAFELARRYGDKWRRAILASAAARDLKQLGFKKDLDAATEVDSGALGRAAGAGMDREDQRQVLAELAQELDQRR